MLLRDAPRALLAMPPTWVTLCDASGAPCVAGLVASKEDQVGVYHNTSGAFYAVVGAKIRSDEQVRAAYAEAVLVFLYRTGACAVQAEVDAAFLGLMIAFSSHRAPAHSDVQAWVDLWAPGLLQNMRTAKTYDRLVALEPRHERETLMITLRHVIT